MRGGQEDLSPGCSTSRLRSQGNVGIRPLKPLGLVGYPGGSGPKLNLPPSKRRNGADAVTLRDSDLRRRDRSNRVINPRLSYFRNIDRRACRAPSVPQPTGLSGLMRNMRAQSLTMAAVLTSAPLQAASSAEFVLVNSSGVTMDQLYISPCGAGIGAPIGLPAPRFGARGPSPSRISNPAATTSWSCCRLGTNASWRAPRCGGDWPGPSPNQPSPRRYSEIALNRRIS